jgi:RNA polymerase sigma-70 factor (ECF subfamily)
MTDDGDQATQPQLLSEVPIPHLVSRAQRGSLPCFAELVKRFEGRLFNFLRRRTGSTHDAEDVVQDTFVRAWQRIDQYDARWQFSTWLFTIAHRLAITQGRRRQREVTWAGADELPTVGRDDPARAVDDREHCGLLWDTADRILSDSQHMVLWLRYAEELSNKEIARVLGRSQISVRVTLFRAREALAAHERRDQTRRDHDSVPCDTGQAAGLKETLAGDLIC